MLTLLTPPALYSRARCYNLPLALAAYRVGPDGRLLQARLPEAMHSEPPSGQPGGMMVVSGEGYKGGGNAAELARAILMECKARGFPAILCDFEPPAEPVLFQAVQWLTQSGRTIVVHEGYAKAGRETRVLIPSAVSGGSLTARLSGAAARYGKNRIVLAAERICEDFRLPAPQGKGVQLSRQELESLRRRYGPAVFFSEELCAQYFTYRAQNGGFHFVLFDDARSIKRKLEVAQEFGIRSVLLPFPEVEDILDAVLEK